MPRRLEAIVRKAMQNDPEVRYQSAGEMAEDLERFLANRPVQALLGDGRGGQWIFGRRGLAGALALVLLALGGWFFFSQSFKAPPDRITVGSGPVHIVSHDLNADRRPDLITADAVSGTVSVLLTRKGGWFSAAAAYKAGEFVQSIDVADLDGNETPDLAVSIQLTKSIQIYFNQGAGVFKPGSAIHLPSRTFIVAASDLDHDGKNDLVATCEREVVILRNAGGGEFPKIEVLNGGPYPNSIAAVDFDRDGFPEIFTANRNQESMDLSIFWNKKGAFETSENIGVGERTIGIVAADLDGDSNPDVAGTGDSTKLLWTLWNKGSRSFELKKTMTSDPVQSVCAGDFDGDGDLDLAVAGGLDYVGLLRTIPGRGFEEVGKLSARYPTSIAAGDFDGDGVLDLAVTNFGPSAEAPDHPVTLYFEVGKRFKAPVPEAKK